MLAFVTGMTYILAGSYRSLRSVTGIIRDASLHIQFPSGTTSLSDLSHVESPGECDFHRLFKVNVVQVIPGFGVARNPTCTPATSSNLVT